MKEPEEGQVDGDMEEYIPSTDEVEAKTVRSLAQQQEEKEKRRQKSHQEAELCYSIELGYDFLEQGRPPNPGASHGV